METCMLNKLPSQRVLKANDFIRRQILEPGGERDVEVVFLSCLRNELPETVSLHGDRLARDSRFSLRHIEVPGVANHTFRQPANDRVQPRGGLD